MPCDDRVTKVRTDENCNMESVVLNSLEHTERFESTAARPHAEIAEAVVNRIVSTMAASLSVLGPLIIMSTFGRRPICERIFTQADRECQKEKKPLWSPERLV